jgi:hypothetical protein
MGIQKYLEKISWLTRRWNIKFQLLTIYIHDHDETWGFNLGSFLVDYHLYCLLSFEFRLPNKTNVQRFVVDHWDFLYLRNSLYNKLEDLEDRKTWSGLSKRENIQHKILSKLFR